MKRKEVINGKPKIIIKNRAKNLQKLETYKGLMACLLTGPKENRAKNKTKPAGLWPSTCSKSASKTTEKKTEKLKTTSNYRCLSNANAAVAAWL